jgi:hypothetical protein
MLYRQAYPEMENLPRSRINLHVREPSKYFFNDLADWDEWKHKNAFSYELIVPATTIDSIKKLMQEDLKRYFNLEAGLQKKHAECLIITRIKNVAPAKGSGEPGHNLFEGKEETKYIRNYPISLLVQFLNEYAPIPVFDETNFHENINLDLPADLSDVKELKEALKKGGFLMQTTTRAIDFFELSEK